MQTVKQLRRDLDTIRKALAVDRKKREVVIRTYFPFSLDKPHGRYGGCLFHMGTCEQEAVSEEEEVAELKYNYDHEIPEHAKRQHDGYSWATFEEFLRAHEFKCPTHKTG